jgi:hypothetical protein
VHRWPAESLPDMIALVREALAELEAGVGHPQAAARFDLTLRRWRRLNAPC